MKIRALVAVAALIAITLPTTARACEDAPGTRCADGTFYIGLHEPTGERMFAAGCDVGMTPQADGTCVGERSLLEWGPSRQDAPIPEHETDANESGPEDWDGREHTETLVRAGGYPAAESCAALARDQVHGHGDWYLPSADELDLLWAATHEPSARRR